MAFEHNSQTAQQEPAWASIDRATLPRMAFADEGQPEDKATWLHPHHWVQDGSELDEQGCFRTGMLLLHRGGLDEAWAAANAEEGGATPEAVDHLQRHRADLGLIDDESDDEENEDETGASQNRAAGDSASGWLRASTSGAPIGVDRQAGVLRGYIVAQEGPFKSDGRGEFDVDALKEIAKLMKAAPNGLKCRFTHPDLSNDGLGKFLGRSRDPWLDKVSVRDSRGELKTDQITVVRADLHFDPSARHTPSGDLAGYVMDLAETDPDALSSSLVIRYDVEYRVDKKGIPLKDENGEELPPLWRPLKLHASDIVDTGDAVDGILSAQLDAEGLPDGVVRQAAALMDRQFAGRPREWVESHCRAWLDRYLSRRYGPATAPKGAVTSVGEQESYDPARDPDRLRKRAQLAGLMAE